MSFVLFIKACIANYFACYSCDGGLTSPDGKISNNVLKQAILNLNTQFLELVNEQKEVTPHMLCVGSSCLVGIICVGFVHVANVGHSRALMGQVRVVTAGSSKAVLWGLIKPKTNIVTTSVNHCASEQHAREEVWKQIDSRDVGFEKTDGKYRVNDLTMVRNSMLIIAGIHCIIITENILFNFRLQGPSQTLILGHWNLID